MKNIIPVFKTEGSLMRSLFSVEDAKNEIPEFGQISIMSVAKNHDLKEITVCDDYFVSFPSLYKKCKKNGVNLIFGCNFTVCNDVLDKTEKSLYSNCKVSVFIKNSDGYKDLLNLHNKIKTSAENFYYSPRADWKMISSLMTKNLKLVFPSYDNFIHKNLLNNGECVPIFKNNLEPVFFYSNQDLPYDSILTNAIKEYCIKNSFEMQEVHNCYYYKPSDFKSYVLMRCFENRSRFKKPEIDFLCSDDFSFQSYLNKTNV